MKNKTILLAGLFIYLLPQTTVSTPGLRAAHSVVKATAYVRPVATAVSMHTPRPISSVPQQHAIASTRFQKIRNAGVLITANVTYSAAKSAWQMYAWTKIGQFLF